MLIADHLKVPNLDLRVTLSEFSPILTRSKSSTHAGSAALVDAMLTRLQAMFAQQLGSPSLCTMKQASSTEGLYDCCHLWQLLGRSPVIWTQVRSLCMNEHKMQS